MIRVNMIFNNEIVPFFGFLLLLFSFVACFVVIK